MEEKAAINAQARALIASLAAAMEPESISPESLARVLSAILDRADMTATDLSEYIESADSTFVELASRAITIQARTFSTLEEATAWAARSEVAGNRDVALIRLRYQGAAGPATAVILQQAAGDNVTMQVMLDKNRIYRRTVSGATGQTGSNTTATAFAETGAHSLAIAGRTLQLRSAFGSVLSSVSLPEESGSDATQYAICDFDGFAPAEASSWTDRSNSWGLTDDGYAVKILWLTGTGFIAWPGQGTEYTRRWSATQLSRKCETLGNNVASKLYRCAADGQLYTYRSRYELAPVPAPAPEIDEATETAAGLMSAVDKQMLLGLGACVVPLASGTLEGCLSAAAQLELVANRNVAVMRMHYVDMESGVASSELTFDHSANTNTFMTDVTVSADGIEGVTAEPLSLNVELKPTAGSITPQILCPNVNGNSGTAVTMNFVLTGLPEGLTVGAVDLDLHALTDSNGYQLSDDGKRRRYNIGVEFPGHGVSGSLGGIDVAAGVNPSGTRHKVWRINLERPLTVGAGTLRLQLNYRGGADINEGCYLGISSITLRAGAPAQGVVLNSTGGAGTTRQLVLTASSAAMRTVAADGTASELTELGGEHAQVQDSENGDADHYIYSVNDKDSQKCVLSAANTKFVTSGDRLCFRRGVWNPTARSGIYYTDPVPTASTSASGAMSAADKTKLDSLPQGEPGKGLSKHDFSDQWLTKLANAGIYGREDNQLRAVRGLFALTADATDEQIRTALTEYATKNELSRAELEYCATNGCRLWDEDTQAPVMVTHNGGGFFNFMELSVTNFQELPRLRYVSLRAHDDGTWTVTRPGATERLVYKSELDTLADRITALESRT